MEDPEGVPTYTEIPFSSLKKDELFTLEAAPMTPEVDPLANRPAVERTFKAHSDPYKSAPEGEDPVWLIKCERM